MHVRRRPAVSRTHVPLHPADSFSTEVWLGAQHSSCHLLSPPVREERPGSHSSSATTAARPLTSWCLSLIHIFTNYRSAVRGTGYTSSCCAGPQAQPPLKKTACKQCYCSECPNQVMNINTLTTRIKNTLIKNRLHKVKEQF